MKNRIANLTLTAICLAVIPFIAYAQSPDTRPQPVVSRIQYQADSNGTPGRLNALQLQRARRMWQQNYERTLHQTNLQLKVLSKRRANPADQLDLTDQRIANTVNEPITVNDPNAFTTGIRTK